MTWCEQQLGFDEFAETGGKLRLSYPNMYKMLNYNQANSCKIASKMLKFEESGSH